MTDYEPLTTPDLIDVVTQDPFATDRETVLASRLTAAIEEIAVLEQGAARAATGGTE